MDGAAIRSIVAPSLLEVFRLPSRSCRIGAGDEFADLIGRLEPVGIFRQEGRRSAHPVELRLKNARSRSFLFAASSGSVHQAPAETNNANVGRSQVLLR